ncbi:MAG: endonuclease/exonuclease/phosphatase family protein [Bacteroidia bacterium]
MFALLGLSYPLLLLINIFFALFWLFQFNLKAILSLGVLVLGISFFNQTFQMRMPSKSNSSDIKIVSYNAGLFGYFQSKWHSGELLTKIKELDADVVCVQEFLNLKDDNGRSTFDTIRKSAGYKYAYFQNIKDGRKVGDYGMAIFSKFKIIENQLVHFDGLTGNMCLFTDLKIDTSVCRVYNVHLQSFKFKKQDYNFIKKMPDDNDEKLRQSKSLLNRMKSAYVKRAEQVESIRKHISDSPYPHFVIGDFNDPPLSYSYAKMSRGVKDAFVSKGSGMGKTYIGLMPNFRIDYILFPDIYECVSYETIKLSSDHSLLYTGLNYKNE